MNSQSEEVIQILKMNMHYVVLLIEGGWNAKKIDAEMQLAVMRFTLEPLWTIHTWDAN